MRYLITGIIAFILLGIPSEGSCQKRQRARAKAKTTAVAKKPAAKNTPKTSAEAKKREAEAQKEIQLTEAQIKENEAKVAKGLSELGKIDVEIDATTSRIKEIDTKLQRLNGDIKGLEGSIGNNEKDLEKLRGEYLKAVKKMRATRKNKSTLAFIFSSKSVSQAMRRMRYLREFSGWRARHTEEINGKIADLKIQREALAKAREEQKVALALQKSNESTLTAQHKQQEAIVAELKQNGKALEAHLKRKQAEAKELGNMVAQLIAEEQRKAEEEARRKAAEEEARRKAEEELLLAHQKEAASGKSDTKVSGKSEGKSPKKGKEAEQDKGKSDNKGVYADARKRTPRSESTTKEGFEGMKGKLGYPVTGSFAVISRFGRQHLPDLPDVEFDNPGIDAESDAGASARAVYAGKVSGVYLLPGYNTVVIVNHGNYYTVYGNISSPSVKTGDSVDAGSSLGNLALSEENPGHSSIHFEVWKNRDKLNPQDWLR